ncbi:MAG: outer membrane protein CzcC [Nitrospinaceae bacterium]|nr:MAG: outer membrane protein CzcC [Nitrospinaceae bacterium]
MKRSLNFLRFGLFLLILIPNSSFAGTEGSIELIKDPTKSITLQKALSLALLKDPELEAFSAEQRAREARALQSGLLPNPQFDILVEDAAGSGNFNGFSQSQTTIQLSQLIELGGKRGARLRADDLSGELAGWDYETKRMDVLTQVSKAYVDVLKAQEKVLLAQNLEGLGEKFLNAVTERVKAGKVASLEKTKAEITVSSMRIKLAKEKRALKIARRNLSIHWENNQPAFESALGDLFAISPLPSLEQLMDRLADNPDLQRWGTELEQRQAVLDREFSKRIPNLNLIGGFRRIEETDDNTLIFGFSIPLQLFDRNQGAISEAHHKLAKVNAEKRAAELKVTKTLLEAYNTVDFSHSQVIEIKTNILPGAQKAFDGVNEGYRFGKFGYLDVLDSQKIFFEAQGQYLEALATHHKAVADVERLIGEPLAPGHQPLATPKGESRP